MISLVHSLFIFVIFFFSLCNAKSTVYVYQDEGVSQEALTHTLSMFHHFLDKRYMIKTISAQQVRGGQWTKDAALFVMPGGADLPYTRKLDGRGNQKIRQYIQDGGSYLGICAGAYYASSYVEFDKGGPLEVLGKRELKFFPGKAVGPTLACYDYKSRKGSRASKITTSFPNVPTTVVYYNGGCHFVGTSSLHGIQVIASYSNKLPAILKMKCGKGTVLLSGVHFEYDPYKLDSSDPYLQAIRPLLIAANESRKLVVKQILKNLKLSILV